MESQDRERVADSSSESSVMEQVQERVADLSSESSALEASSRREQLTPRVSCPHWSKSRRG